MKDWTRYIGLIILLTTTTESIGQASDREVTIIVKDPSKYSQRFIDGLREIGPGTKFELRDDSIITDNKYRNSFSQLLPKDKKVILTGQKEGKKYELTLDRVNYTTISYGFSITDEKGTIVKENGLADITPQFMLGSESDEDENGHGYFCSEYFTVGKQYLYSIRIGLRDKVFLAKVIAANGKLTLDYCPTLK